jgi:uncharacterized protein with GYD domain
MPVYISLGRFTRKGMMEIKKRPERLEQARKAVEAVGGNLKEFHLTFGRFDFVAITEGPSDEAALKEMYDRKEKLIERLQELARCGNNGLSPR